jgi:hypothetical protein
MLRNSSSVRMAQNSPFSRGYFGKPRNGCSARLCGTPARSCGTSAGSIRRYLPLPEDVGREFVPEIVTKGRNWQF